jgi:hypothetical protein
MRSVDDRTRGAPSPPPSPAGRARGPECCSEPSPIHGRGQGEGERPHVVRAEDDAWGSHAIHEGIQRGCSEWLELIFLAIAGPDR